jgi:hypothetical protein
MPPLHSWLEEGTVGSAMNWYYSDGGQAKGPVNEAALEGMLRDGGVAKDTLVWQPQLSEWGMLQKLLPALLDKVRREREKLARDPKKITAPVTAPESGESGTSGTGLPAEPPLKKTPAEKPGLLSRWFGRDKN